MYRNKSDGAGPSKVALMTGMTIDEAADFIEEYMNRYPKLRQWLIDQGESAITNGFTTSVGGRKRFYNIPSIDHKEYEKIISQIKRWASNHPIQATNADMLKMAMRSIYLEIRGGKWSGKPLLSGRFKLVVHDEIVMEWLEEEVGIGMEIMERCMNAAYYALLTGVINKVDVVPSDSWEKA